MRWPRPWWRDKPVTTTTRNLSELADNYTPAILALDVHAVNGQRCDVFMGGEPVVLATLDPQGDNYLGQDWRARAVVVLKLSEARMLAGTGRLRGWLP